MACPTKRNGSENWYFRRRIPADVRAALAKLPKAQRPRNWYDGHISISLKTADRIAAKAKCPEVAAEVERTMAALRSGPKALTAKQIATLSGIAYRAFAQGLEDNPGLSPQQWLHVAEANALAQRGRFGLGANLGIFPDQDTRRDFSMEQRFGGMVDATLVREGMVTDDHSRWKLIEALARDLTEAAKKLARNADGDYSPDSYADRFPLPTDGGPTEQSKRTLSELAAAWHTAALARKVRPRDAQSWKAVVLRFKDWLKHDDLSRVTLEKVQGWGDERNAKGIKPKTINDTDFAALRAVFGWGIRRGWLSANPAQYAKIEGRGKTTVRESYFSEDEIKAILTAAMAVKETQRENPKTTNAKRWVPWLCAYSGARVSEMIQLRKEDIRKDGEGWVIRLTPDAGAIKTNEFRDVPVHEHLINLGFLGFVDKAEGGPLFCMAGKDGTITGPASGVYKRVRDLVRSVVPDPGVQPNHAWRYTFKTLGFEAGIDRLALDAICGHGPKSQGEDYTKVTLKKRTEAMVSFPRYQIGGTA